MNPARRLYDLSRAYVGQEWDRINSYLATAENKISERNHEERAREELRESWVLGSTLNTTAQPASSTASQGQTQIFIPQGQSREQVARTILGVEETATFQDIRKSYEKKLRRSQPTRFAEGSQESLQAAEIAQKVEWAYGVLTDSVSRTEKRFGTLEID
ncbi:MAG: J domain-containing protein [Fimbriimonadaceae bacterium]|jgi:hypothetical protein|nr:J domain-containing protein [Fimbriimonadaceae bacterium]